MPSLKPPFLWVCSLYSHCQKQKVYETPFCHITNISFFKMQAWCRWLCAHGYYATESLLILISNDDRDNYLIAYQACKYQINREITVCISFVFPSKISALVLNFMWGNVTYRTFCHHETLPRNKNDKGEKHHLNHIYLLCFSAITYFNFISIFGSCFEFEFQISQYIKI